MKCIKTMGIIVMGAAVAASCARGPSARLGKVQGRITTEDSRVGVICGVEVNSTAPPLLVPIVLELKTGERFESAVETNDGIKDMYVAVRCEGYETLVSRIFELKPGAGVDLGLLTVKRK